MSHQPTRAEKRRFLRSLQQRNPKFVPAVGLDARYTCHQRGERHEFRSRFDTLCQVLRLMWVSDAFAAHVSYRLRASLLRRGVPLLPRMLHRYAMRSAQVSIGPGVLMHPGVYIVHGQIVIDGLVEVGTGTVIAPWVTIGLRGSIEGPVIGNDVNIGTGAKVLGTIKVGREARIGANAVVTSDIPERTTAVGMPARVVRTND